jgi:hypothetical protein
VVASAFEATTANMMFGNIQNAISWPVGPMPIHVLNGKLAKQLLAAFLTFVFACTVQFTCTVHTNSAIHCTVHVNNASELHCSREQCNSLALFEWLFFFFSVYSFCIFILKKTSFALSCTQYFFSQKTSIERIKFTRTVISN